MTLLLLSAVVPQCRLLWQVLSFREMFYPRTASKTFHRFVGTTHTLSLLSEWTSTAYKSQTTTQKKVVRRFHQYTHRGEEAGRQVAIQTQN